MNPARGTTPSRKAWADWLVVCIFAALLWLPTFDFFTGIDVTRPPDENRLPAPKPKLTERSFSGFQNYTGDTEIYFNDHFGFRKRLIRWCQQWKAGLYHDYSGHKVVVGQHGWLFTGELQMIEHYLGMQQFTPAQLRSWQQLLEKRRDWLAARGIKYLFVIPPDKHSVYPEELPGWLQNAAPTNRVTKLDQFVQYMKANSTVEILDLRPSMLAAKTTAPLYLQNDTHWNQFGSFIGAQDVIHSLSKDFANLQPLKLADYRWTNSPTAKGDLLSFLGVQRPEKNYFEFTPQSPGLVPQVQASENVVSTWKTRKPGAISENSSANMGTMIIFGDSFCHGWHLYLGSRFQRIFFFGENREFNVRIIEENHPQVVVNEMLERMFNTHNPGEIMVRDALP